MSKCIAQDWGNCKYCKVPNGIKLCENRRTLTPTGAGKALNLAEKCGVRRYEASAQVDDRMLMDARDMGAMMDHIHRQMIHNMAATIVKQAPQQNFIVERRDRGHGFPSMYPGSTEYRMAAYVFSPDQFNKFVQTLLDTYGDEYATAALATKKNILKKTLAAAVDKA